MCFCINSSMESRHVKGRNVHEDFTVEDRKVVGTGLCGQLKVAVRKKDGKEFALKTYSKVGMDETKLNNLRDEISVHLAVDHPHIVHLDCVFETEEHVHMALELLAGQDLFEHLDSHRAFPDRKAARTTHDVLSALSYLHRHGIVHRDVKLENIMFEDRKCTFAKLIDFGFATRWNGKTKLSQACGTAGYDAPELYKYSYTDAVDMWSLGVTVYSMLLNTSPFREPERPGVKCPNFGVRFRSLSRNAQYFLRSLLKANPADRLTASDALAHPWFDELPGKCGDVALDSKILGSLEIFSRSPRQCFCPEVRTYSTTDEFYAKVREQFKAMAEEQIGVITESALRKAMPSIAGDLEQIFQKLDANGDNEISFSEFVAGTMQSCAMQYQAYQDAFHCFDTNDQACQDGLHCFDVHGNNIITADKCETALEMCGELKVVTEGANGTDDGALNASNLSYMQPSDDGRPTSTKKLKLADNGGVDATAGDRKHKESMEKEKLERWFSTADVLEQNTLESLIPKEEGREPVYWFSAEDLSLSAPQIVAGAVADVATVHEVQESCHVTYELLGLLRLSFDFAL